MNMMEPLRTQRRIGTSSVPSKSALIFSETSSIAEMISLYGIKVLNVLPLMLIFSIGNMFVKPNKFNRKKEKSEVVFSKNNMTYYALR